MLMQFDPFGDVDRLLAEALRAQQRRAMPMDAYQQGNELVIAFDLPGLDPAAVTVTLWHGHLTVRAERSDIDAVPGDVLVRERPSGHWTRRVLLSDALDLEAMTASYERGVLTVRVPLRTAAIARQVAIDAPEESASAGTGP